MGILFAGEMGSTIGRILRERGIRVVTTIEGRGPRTARRCREADLEVLPSLGAVIACADVVLSVVPPSAAIGLARSYADALALIVPAAGPPDLRRVAGRATRQPGERRRLYVDLNSISPLTMIEVATIVGDTGTDVVDASIHGLAARLPGKGTLYLSGPAAEETAVLLGSPLRTVVLGDEVGRASLLKMLIGGVNKGLVALLLELSLVADAEGILDEFWAVCRAAYPGVMEPFERLLPTYPEHAARRVDEIAELERTVSAADRTPVMASAIRTVIQEATGAPVEIRLLVGRLAASQAASAEPRRG